MSKIKIDRKYKVLYGLFEKRIEKGVRYLDRKMPREEWMEKLNVLTLSLESRLTCVCGQVFGDYFEEFNEAEDGVKYGFAVGKEELGELSKNWHWDLLSYLWGKKLVDLKFKNGFK